MAFYYKAIVAIFLLYTFGANCCCFAQISDSDDQFQVFHGDIGRISGGQSNSNVAPQTQLVRLPPQQEQLVATQPAPVPVTPAAFERTSPIRSSSRQQHQQQQQPTRKPNRITLAVRTSAPVQVSLVSNEPAPASIAAQQLFPARSEPSFSSQAAATASQLVAPPQFHSSFAPLPDREPANLVAPQQPTFRSTLGHTNSVTARHSALIAQVAAERAAAASSGAAVGPTDFPAFNSNNQQPSLGSPIEALSAPAVAQVQPPPLLVAPSQQHQHQQPAQASSPQFNFINQPEEPLVAPSFDHVLGHGCPMKGVFSYENKDHCDRYYMCTNGTFTEEACPNGLAYSQMGAVYQHCAYNWNVDCGTKKTSEPLASPGCPWQFGIFPITQAGHCSIDYFACEWGVPETKRCSPEGLFYDDRIKGCQWADQLGCKSEALLNFKCPPEDEDNPYWPYPRYYHTKQDIIVCVNEQPRLVHCNEDQIVDPSSLACMDLKKKKKKF